jgi:hypothetical protein
MNQFPRNDTPLFGRRIIAAATLGLAFTIQASSASAQCAADCNGDGNVAINELIRAVSISLGNQDVSTCPAADTNSNGAVAINELIQGVNASLNGCPPVTPATTTPTPTNTEVQGTPTDTPTPRDVPPNCGDGSVDLDEGETCDDGNTEEGPRDFCPANCSILSCDQMVPRQTFSLAVNFATDDSELLIQALTVFVRYPDGLVGIPGANNDPPVLQSITPGVFDGITPNDQEYGLTLVLQDQSFVGSNGGTAATVEFDVCEGSSQPPIDAFSCLIAGATDINFVDVPESVSCELAFR